MGDQVCRLVLASLMLATVIPFRFVEAKDEPPKSTSDAVREELLAAYFAAPAIRHAFVFKRGEKRNEIEMFRSGDRIGSFVRGTGLDDKDVWIVCDGRRFAIVSERGGIATEHLVAQGPSERWPAYEKALRAIAERGAGRALTIPPLRLCHSLSIRTSTQSVEKLTLGCQISFGPSVEPDWLQSSAFASRPGTVVDDLVPATIGGFPALVHRSDGFVSQMSGRHAKTGEFWTLTETRSPISPERWIEKIDSICRSPPTPEGEAFAIALFGGLSLRASVEALGGLPATVRSDPRFLRWAIVTLASCAWRSAEATTCLRRMGRESYAQAMNGLEKRLSDSDRATARADAVGGIVGSWWSMTQGLLGTAKDWKGWEGTPDATVALVFQSLQEELTDAVSESMRQGFDDAAAAR